MTLRLIILGASARAAAISAVRAGFEPWTADLFADADLRASVRDAVRCPVDDYPRGFREILRDAPDAPWIYTGGLENHPDLIRDLSEIRPLWGNGPDVLAACRAPFRVERLLREAGFATPQVRGTDAELPDGCRWLRKPLKGSGGQGIDFAARSETGSDHFYQQFIDGPAYSGVFVRARGETRLLGVTEQLVGPVAWLNAPAFRYAGNVGPVDLGSAVRGDLLRLGQLLAEACHLRGIFGVDFILHDDRSHVVEVNPRYTASIEVLERCLGLRALTWHRLEFDPVAATPVPGDAGRPCCIKAILYAERRFVAPASFAGLVRDVVFGNGNTAIRFADVPAPDEVSEPGWPVLTLMADGESRVTCLESLQRQAERIMSAGRSMPPPGR
jgi:predicted ATP-grasp superfamily ATP-dependent carboligase